jgi:hypothetical protein
MKAKAAYHSAAILIATILSGWSTAPTQAQNRIVSETVATWNFGAAEDKRKDGWPDGWQRTTGQNYPKFIPIAISQHTSTLEELQEFEAAKRMASQLVLAYEYDKWPWQVIPEATPPVVDQWLEKSIANPYLRIQMDGGAAEVISPALPVSDNSVYYASALAKSNSDDFSVRIKLRFLDASKQMLFETASKPLHSLEQWNALVTEAVYDSNQKMEYVQVVLSVTPKNAQSFKALIGFDAVRVHRTPRLTLFVDKATQMYRQGESVVVRCTATGMNIDQPSLTLSLVDHTGAEILSANKLVVREEKDSSKYVSTKTKPANNGAGATKNSKPTSPLTPPASNVYWDGYCEWMLPNLPSGYYEISTHLARGTNGSIELLQHFVVLPLDPSPRLDTRFGWTMKDQDADMVTPARTSKMIEVMKEARVGKVKLPIWFDNFSPNSMREFTDRIDRVQTAGIACVGVIATPPQSIREKFPRLESLETGVALEDPVMTQSFLEPVMRAMCVRLVDFQLGWDHEADFVTNPRFAKSLDTILRLAKRYGQDTQLIASHHLQLPIPKTTGVDRWQLYSEDELTDEETYRLVSSTPANAISHRLPWFSISPIDANKYSLDVRVQDLAARMLAMATADSGGQNTAWISDPTHPQVGVLDKAGGPREMFLPFRSLATALAGMRNVGSIPVPELGYNRIVVSADHARLIAWSPQNTSPALFLGSNVSAHDVWGRKVEVKNIDTELGPVQQLEIGKWPVIIDGIDPRVAQWRMGISIVDRKVDPLQGGNQELQLRFVNPLGSPAVGSVTLVAPAILAEPASASFDIEPNASDTISIPFILIPDASASTSDIRLDFRMSGDNPVRFSMDDELQIGSDDVEFNLEYQIDSKDQLVVTVEAISFRAEPVSFDCRLSVPLRPHERTHFAGLKERTSQTFVFPKASELIGETIWLRCEQFETRKVLNQQKKILLNRSE